jgi:hypothetical protein
MESLYGNKNYVPRGDESFAHRYTEKGTGLVDDEILAGLRRAEHIQSELLERL